MEVKISKAQLKEIIVKHYKKIGCSNLRVKFFTEVKESCFLNFSSDKKIESLDTNVLVEGCISNNDILYKFSERVDMDNLMNIVKNSFDEDVFDVRCIEYDYEKIPIFGTYCQGIIVNLGKKGKTTGKYIVKK